ncbi:tetrahydromethanopterin S-methyltransferase subunit MtrB [Methanocella conradii]|uniref:tetrahydromethanopterin S-methyltransferase subunit MtrB n=1 Tax=Methanocella conradii TaxID=1175444 RepID=UPI00157D3250|nr:tetrahydromethanopterin S-methyltransferase subunit B [Methanocella conradii]
MGVVKLLPEYGLVYEVETGKVVPESGNMVKYSMDPVNAALDKLDKYADDLMNSLAPTGNFLESFPHREKSLYYAGIFTNMFYGFIFGLLVAFLVVILRFMGLI